MALTLNNFWGWETGGYEECNAVSGSYSIETSLPKHGTYYFRAGAAGGTGYAQLNPFESVLSAGTGIIVGGYVRFGTQGGTWPVWSLTDGTNTDFSLEFVNAGFNWGLNLYNSAGSAVITVSSGLTSEDTWPFVEVFVQRVDSGSAEVYLDGSLVGSCSGQDFNAITGTTYLRCRGNAGSQGHTDYDSMYFLSGVTNGNDRLGGCEVYAYRSNLNSATPDSGSALTTGTWLAVQTVPFDGTVGATYDGGPIQGRVNTNDVGGSAGTGGPNTDANITGSIVGLKGIWKMERGTGAGTYHYGHLGNSASPTTITGYLRTRDLDPGTAAANYTHVVGAQAYAPNGYEYITSLTTPATYLHLVAFSSDGYKAYLGDWGTVIREYTLTTPYDLAATSYTGYSIDVGATILAVTGSGLIAMSLSFNDAGTRMYVSASQWIIQWELSTGFDLSTISYAGKYYDTGLSAGSLLESVCNRNGTLFGCGNAGSLYRWDLTDDDDVTTASLAYSSNLGGPIPWGISMSSDGTVVAVRTERIDADTSLAAILHLSTAYDIRTWSTPISWWGFYNASFGATTTAIALGGSSFLYIGGRTRIDKYQIGKAPSKTEYCAIGMEMSSAQDFELYDMLATVMHVPSQAVGAPAFKGRLEPYKHMMMR